MEDEARKLKIVQVIDIYENASNGAAISTERFTKLLRENGHTVWVASTGRTEQHKIPLREFYPPGAYLKKIMQRMKFVFALPDKQALTEIIKQSDIVHNQLPFYLGYWTVRIARKLKKPIISTFHVQGEQLTQNAGLKNPIWVKIIYKLFIYFIYNRSDLVICPSTFAETEIKKYGLKKPTVVISNGVPSEYRPHPFPKKYPDKFAILTVGRNAVEKRQEMIIQAIAASRFKDNIQLIVLGDGPQRSKLEQLSRKSLTVQTEFNLLPAEKIIEYYNSTDIYIHAAAVEVECMTDIEAMACGLPLLIADAPLSATKQFALSEKFLFQNTDDLTQKIDYWYTHIDELIQSKAHYLQLSAKYSTKASYNKLEEVYYKIAGIKKPNLLHKNGSVSKKDWMETQWKKKASTLLLKPSPGKILLSGNR